MIKSIRIFCILLLVWTMQIATTKQLQKMKQLEQMFMQYEQSDLTVSEFCKKNCIHRSHFYYWESRYKQHEESGLIDQRRGVPYKVTGDRRKFIVKYKIKNPLSSCRDIAVKFKLEFGIDLHFTRVAQTLKAEKLNDAVGRKTGKPIKKTRVTRI